MYPYQHYTLRADAFVKDYLDFSWLGVLSHLDAPSFAPAGSMKKYDGAYNWNGKEFVAPSTFDLRPD
jgi:hypothetical protein